MDPLYTIVHRRIRKSMIVEYIVGDLIRCQFSLFDGRWDIEVLTDVRRLRERSILTIRTSSQHSWLDEGNGGGL